MPSNSRYINATFWINYLLISIVFAFNFMANPALKWVSLIYVAFIFATVLILDFKQSLIVIIGYCFLEGQGRVLWEYNPFFRISFDLLIGLAILRNFLIKRDLKIIKILPLFMVVLIFLHFLWYVVEIFNTSSISMFLPLAATKVYIFPFLLFFLLRHNQEAFDKDRLKSIGALILFLLVLEVALSLVQMNYKQDFMLALSPYYKKQMKGDLFTDFLFRPFGTAHVPGSISTWFYLSTGFLFLNKDFSKKKLAFLTGLDVLIGMTIMVCQVRSAFVKFVFLVLGCLFALMVNTEKRMKTLFRGLVILTIFVTGLIWYFSNNLEKVNEYIDLEAGVKRWEKIDDYNSFKAKRAGPLEALNVAQVRLEEFPFGIGPGMTAASLILSADVVKNDPVYDSDIFWGFDNFYLSVITEFGYGAIFYITLILGIPFLLFSRFKALFLKKDYYSSRIVMISLLHVVVILIGNWGVIGLGYNPESFFFWLWTALGLNVYDNSMKETEISPSI